MAPRAVVAAALAVLGLAAATGAVGTILTTNADLQVGSGSTPGTITIDPSYGVYAPPSVPAPDPLGPIGSITGSLPAFPGAGTGADGIFTSGSGATLSAGTYNFSSFTVDSNADVFCSGPVVILVTGNATIGGQVYSTAGGAGITLRCGGNLTIAGGDVNTTNYGIDTSGGSSPVSVHAMGDVRLGDQLNGNLISYVTSASGDVTVTGGGAGKDFLVGNTVIEASSGMVMVRAAASMELTGFRTRVQSSVGVPSSEMRVQAFGGDLYMNGSLVQANNFAGNLFVEASAGVTLENGAVIRGVGNPSAQVTAFGGDLVVSHSTLSASAGGYLILGASAGISFDSSVNVSTEDGYLGVVAHGGNLDIQPPGSNGGAFVSTEHGDMRLAASGDFTMGSDTYISSFDGRTDVDAFGDVVATGSGSIRLGSSVGDLEVVAAGAVQAAVDNSEGPSATWKGGAVRIFAGAAGIDLDVVEVVSFLGDLDVIATGPVAVHGEVSAAGNLSIESAAGSVDISGSRLDTNDLGAPVTANLGVASAPPPPTTSGSIVVWSHLLNGTVDATGAVLRTGDSPQISGDIGLLVNGVSPPVESFILPKRIVAKYNASNPGNSRLVSSGFLDTGPYPVDLTSSCDVAVGDLDFEIPGFTPNAPGTKFAYKSPGLQMSIAASKAGSSRAKFRLTAVGAFTQSPELDGDVTLRFASNAAEGFGIVALDAGKFALGRKRGALVEPNLHLFKAKATLKGQGQDAVSLKLGLATNGTTPEAAPDLHIGFGAYGTDVGGGTMVRSGDRFTFHGPAGGVTLVVLDYRKETITIQAKGVDLGEIAEGASAVPIRISLGTDERIVTVRMGRKGPAFVY